MSYYFVSYFIILYNMLRKVLSRPVQTYIKIYPELGFKLQFDGYSKTINGISWIGTGSVIYHNNREIWNGSFFLKDDTQSNNYAEYMALIIGLEKAIDLDIKSLLVESHSSLIINQMKGLYDCKSLTLINLYNRTKQLEDEFDSMYFNYILKENNKRATYLSSIAVCDE